MQRLLGNFLGLLSRSETASGEFVALFCQEIVSSGLGSSEPSLRGESRWRYPFFICTGYTAASQFFPCALLPQAAPTDVCTCLPTPKQLFLRVYQMCSNGRAGPEFAAGLQRPPLGAAVNSTEGGIWQHCMDSRHGGHGTARLVGAPQQCIVCVSPSWVAIPRSSTVRLFGCRSFASILGVGVSSPHSNAETCKGLRDRRPSITRAVVPDNSAQELRPFADALCSVHTVLRCDVWGVLSC